MRVGRLLIVAAVLGTLNMVAKEPALNLPLDPQGKITYHEEVPIKGVNAAELYARARAWVAQTYQDPQDEFQLDDQARKQLAVRGYFSISYLGDYAMLRHALTIEPKDGQYRVTLTDLVLDWDNNSIISVDSYMTAAGQPRKGANKMLVQADKACRDALTSLAAAMHKPSPAEKKAAGKKKSGK